MAGVPSHGRAIPSRRVQVLSTPATRPRVVAPLAILAFAALLRFVFLDDQSYWLDEAITVRTIELDFSQMLDRVYDNESTPPLYYVVAWAWAKLFGTGEAGLRSLSALAGTAFVAVAYLTGRQARLRAGGADRRGRWPRSARCSSTTRRRRAPTRCSCCSARSRCWASSTRARSPPDARSAGWALASALAIATHYYAVFLVVAEAVWLAVLFRRRAVPAIVAVTAGRPRPASARAAPARPRPGQLPARRLARRPTRARAQAVPGRLRGAGRSWSRGGRRSCWRSPGSSWRCAPTGANDAARSSPPCSRSRPCCCRSRSTPDTFGTRNSLAAWLPAAIVVATGFAAARPRPLGLALAARARRASAWPRRSW